MELILMVIALILSAFFSGSETVFLSANKIRIEVLHRRKVKGTKQVFEFIKSSEKLFVTTLIGNNLANVLFSSFIVLFLRDSFEESLIILISSLTVLILGEIIPKVIARESADQLIIRNSYVLRVFYYLFYPVGFFFISLSNFLLKLFHASKEQKVEDILTRTDVKRFMQESEIHGIIETMEHEIIARIFELNQTRLKETMVPRTEMMAVDKSLSIAKLRKTFCQSGFSRLPVCDGNIDSIIGVVYAKDLFRFPQNMEEIMQEIRFVPETKSAYEMLQEFRRTKTSIAIVLDEYGGTAGLVTLEDVIEELFGEIYDEFDIDHKHMYFKVNPTTIILDARAEIDEINDKFDLHIPEGDYTSIGGFVIETMGTIPEPKEGIELENCKIIVERADEKRVIAVKIIVKKSDRDSDS
ncbi:MAG: hemolysin family protein [Candidatus Zhuqueibacterota bacterium]